jgi:hypothetical protein
MEEIDKLYQAEVIKNDIKYLPAKKKYEYMADLEMAVTQHVAMINMIGRIIVRLNDRGITINDKIYKIIVGIAQRNCNITPY